MYLETIRSKKGEEEEMVTKSFEKLCKACSRYGYDIIDESGDTTTIYRICGNSMITTDIVKLALKVVGNNPMNGCYVTTISDIPGERRPALVIYWSR